MVARIKSGKSIKGAINYNEKKVSEGKAELIAAKHYHKAHHRLNFHDKLNRLQNLANLNTRTGTNCVHLSLNFDPSENLPTKKLIQMAEAYMQGINFDGQPYLVYHHHDAAHQHIHIVSTNIQRDGKRISLHNMGRTTSEKIRKEIEVKFGLVKANRKSEKNLEHLKSVNLEKAVYGKSETRRAITNVVNQVISQYKFSSLHQFNAVLQQYNVVADRGGKGSRMFEKRGLQYSILDNQFNKIGVPIKASIVYGKPTLAQLESKFEANKKTKMLIQPKVKEMIQKALTMSKSKDDFIAVLNQQNVHALFRINDQNFIYGIAYIDHNTKTVFNGSELGKELSAAALRAKWERCEPAIDPVVAKTPVVRGTNEIGTDHQRHGTNEVVDVLIQPKNTFDYVPPALKKKRRRKKGKRL